VIGATLPDFINPDNIRNIALAVGIASLVLIVFVLRFVQKIMFKAGVTALLAIVGIGAWYYRADLGDCAKTCECRIVGFDIKVPKEKNPACSATPAAPRVPTR
jgi:hypothetical protein